MGAKFLIIFRNEVFKEPLLVAKQVREKLEGEIVIYIPENLKGTLENLLKDLKLINVKVQISEEKPKKTIENEKPYLIILPRKRVAPIVHAFKKYWSEKLIEDLEKYNFLLVEEGFTELKKALLYIDRDVASEKYIKTAYQFLKDLEIEFEIITVFDERYFTLLIKKEHPEMEAKQLLGKMFEDYINAVREKVKKALNLEKVEILPIKGEVHKALPYYVKTHNYDLLVISHAYDTKDELIENSETSVAVFEN
jgi:hypothetical protein